MTTRRDPDRQIHAFLLEGDELLNDQVYDVVRAEIERKRQRAFIGPWRTPIMNKLVTYGLGAAAVVVLIFAGSQFFGSPGGTGTEPTPTASPSNSGPPPLTQTFTSTMHGISMSYPEGWTAQAASEPWTEGTFPLNYMAPEVDVLMDPTHPGDLFLIFASQPIGDSTPEDWLVAQLTSEDGCGSNARLPITVDGAAGLTAEDCDVAAVTTAGRGYWIQLYTGGDDPVAVAPYDRAWFEEVLATVQLQPEAAVEPSPPLTQSFTSTLHGYSVSYPEGWSTQAATEPWTSDTFPLEFTGAAEDDVMYDPILEDHLFLTMASQPIGDSTPEDWVASQMASGEGCATTEAVTVDGASGLIGAEGCHVAVVTTAGRGYWIQLFTSDDDPDAVAAYDRAWFEEVLATVQLMPEDAVD